MPQDLMAAESPHLEVTVFLATDSKKTFAPAPKHDAFGLRKAFEGKGFNFFYRLNHHTLTFGTTDVETLVLPGKRRVVFKYRTFRNQQQIYEFTLPDFQVKATLKIPLGQTLYQAGIEHNGGTVILRIRAKKSMR